MTLPAPPAPEVVRVLRDYRASLIAREDYQTERMARSWMEVENRLNQQMILLAYEIDKAKREGSVVTEQLIARQESYQRLQLQMQEEVLRYANTTAAQDIAREQQEYGALGLRSSQQAIQMASGSTLGIEYRQLNVGAMEDLVGFLGDGTPLERLLREAYPDALDGVVNGLLDGVSQGLNPNQVARTMAEGLGLGLDRITLIARTEQLRVYRTASQRQYEESGVVSGHRRLAAHDACMACLLSDGELIPVDEVLTDHPRGRCTSVPVVAGTGGAQWETGREWFERQDEDYQREAMGDAAYEAWKEGRFDLSALAGTRHSDVWGDSPQTTSLQELLHGEPSTISPVSLGEEGYIMKESDSFDEMAAYQLEAFNATDRLVLRDYASLGYSDINGYLREGPRSIRDSSRREEVRNRIEHLDTLFDTKAALIGDSVTVYRGLHFDDSEIGRRDQLLEQLSEGSIFQDQAFVSTSLQEDLVYEQFLGRDDERGGSLLLQIDLPPGTPVLAPGYASSYEGETEYLLRRNSQFLVKGIDYDEELEITIIALELIP